MEGINFFRKKNNHEIVRATKNMSIYPYADAWDVKIGDPKDFLQKPKTVTPPRSFYIRKVKDLRQTYLRHIHISFRQIFTIFFHIFSPF